MSHGSHTSNFLHTLLDVIKVVQIRYHCDKYLEKTHALKSVDQRPKGSDTGGEGKARLI